MSLTNSTVSSPLAVRPVVAKKNSSMMRLSGMKIDRGRKGVDEGSRRMELSDCSSILYPTPFDMLV